jgi:hypothetical protein
MTPTIAIAATLLILFGAAFELARLTGRRAARRRARAARLLSPIYQAAAQQAANAFRVLCDSRDDHGHAPLDAVLAYRVAIDRRDALR